MTLRELINDTNHIHVFKWLVTKYNTFIYEGDKLSYKDAKRLYSPVIKELLSFPKHKTNKYHLCVHTPPGVFSGELECSLLNLKYKKPKEGLLPWGKRKGDKLPTGYFDCNADKHQRYFGIGAGEWRKLIDTPIIVGDGLTLSNSVILGEILYELIFYGWTEAQRMEEFKKLKSELTKRLKEIDKINDARRA